LARTSDRPKVLAPMMRTTSRKILFVVLLLVGALLVRAEGKADSCPAGCQTWFNGCNTCDCTAGIMTCTREICDQHQTPRCLDQPSAVAPVAPDASTQTRTNEDGCLAYARAAVEQYDALRAAGCNCWNARWHNNFDAHRDWCLSLPNWNDSRPEFDTRHSDIGWCKSGRRPC